MSKKIIKLLFFLFACLLITSCKTPGTFHQANAAVEQTHAQIKQRQAEIQQPPPPVVTLSGYYVDTKPIPNNTGPKWQQKHITLQAQSLPFAMLVQRILRNTEMTIEYGNEVNQKISVSMNYKGTIKGALQALSAQTNYAYQINSNILTWTAFETKTLNIAFMPGSSQYLVGQTPNRQNYTNHAGSTTTTVSTIRGNLNEQQYSNLQGKLSLWEDLKRTLNNLKSPDGKIIISEATTTVTVHDHPSNVHAIENYINQLNQNLSKQVSLKVEVLELQLQDQFNYGINWNLVAKTIAAKVFHDTWRAAASLKGNLASDTNLATSLSGGVATGSGLTTLQLGTDSSNAIINALSQQGKLSVITQPTVVTMNNQIAEVRITQDTSYLESVSTTSIVNEGTTTSLNPGRVTDGFTLYLLPKIKNSTVYLQISSTLSTLTSLDKISSSTDSSTTQSIQIPTLSEKHFNQRTILNSGETLVITGFKQLRDETKQSALFGIKPLGGKGAKRKNTQTIVLITPTIINNG